MPELPDVDLYRRTLEAHALHQKILRVVVSDARILGDLAEKDFVTRLEGNRLESARRHGKHLLVRLARDGWLTMHFGMTGSLRYVEPAGADVPYGRVRLDFKDGSLAYVNRRMLGRVGLADDADAFIAAEGLGPDALDPAFDLATLSAALDGRREVKAVLMDQRVVAGIGTSMPTRSCSRPACTPGRRAGGSARQSASRCSRRSRRSCRRRSTAGPAPSSSSSACRRGDCCRSATRAGPARVAGASSRR